MLQVPFIAFQLNTTRCHHIRFRKLLPFSFSATLLTVSQLHGTFFVYFLISLRQVMGLINKHFGICICLVFMCEHMDLAARLLIKFGSVSVKLITL
jgi:hypothetical protein